MVYPGFPDPSIVCTFITDTKIFVNLYHSASLTHYHFIWDIEARKISSKTVSIVLDSNKKNFVYKCFYNDEKNEIYSFYRQGEAYIINAENLEDYTMNDVTDNELG